MRARFLLIHNPLAGRRGNKLSRRVIAELLRRGAHVTKIEEQDVEAASAKISALKDISTFDAVLVAGGDGTVRALARTIAQRQIPLGLIPAGTGNVLAHEIGQPFDVPKIVEALLYGPEIEIDGSNINGQPFLLMAGVGFDADVIARLNLGIKQRVGKFAYVWPVIRALISRPQEFDIVIDGTKHKATWVVATRACHYAGTFNIAHNADLRTPGMIAVLFKAKTRRARLLELAALASDRLDQVTGVQQIACDAMTITAMIPLSAQADGDTAGMTPLEISTGHPRMHLIVPRAYTTSANTKGKADWRMSS